MNSQAIRPFRIAVPQEELDDLRERLDRTRFTEELPDTGWDYGVPVGYVRDLVAHWRTRYDWRVWEAKLNQHPQFTTEIGGQRIHFLQVLSPEPGATPLILTHGWPGSIAEFVDVIGRLTDPRAHGGDPATAFHLVIPSLPGFGFSGPTTERGWGPRRIAAAWAELMTRLGYDRFCVAGNDWGTFVSLELGRLAPERVVGVHVTQIFTGPSGDPGELDDLTEDEQAAMDNERQFEETMSAYAVLQTQQPQSLAHALADSPAGLLGWHCLIYRGGLDPDFILTNVMIHWLTGTVASAMRIYYEARQEAPAAPTTVPVALAQFSEDTKPVRRFVHRDHQNLVSWNVFDRPGHFAATQSPDLLITDIQAFFQRLLGH
ncbi:epoxide hydrolase family protein [Kribbella sp. NPDC003505]|uniref:epoxide hydrolase family protein n=1 Tax=Kribbella sp. NPDC003505 TaxID=3154448 RepID=UPI00339DC24B